MLVRHLLLAAVLLAATGFQALAGDLPGPVAQQYKQATADFQQCYGNATIAGTVQRDYPQKKKSIQQSYVYRAAGPKFRLDVTTITDTGLGKPVQSGEHYIATPEGSLHSYRKPTSETFDDANELTYSQVKAKIAKLCPLLSPFKLGAQGSIYDHLRQSNVRVLKVEKVARDGLAMLKISYDESHGSKSHPAAGRSYFVLSPDEGYAVREYRRTTGHGDTALTERGIIDYDGIKSGVPLVRRIETWKERGPKSTLEFHELVEVSRFTTGTPDDYFFTGFAF